MGQSQPIVIQPGIEPGSVVMPLALRCSALDRCAIRDGLDYGEMGWNIGDTKSVLLGAQKLHLLINAFHCASFMSTCGILVLT